MNAGNGIKEEKTASASRKKSLALKFISGRFIGGTFTLPRQGELVIGRGSDSDITISEDMVSRQHAKIVIGPGSHIYIEDLRSTNGTFVNGERVQKASLSEGNRILIGTSILKLVAVEGGEIEAEQKVAAEFPVAAKQESVVVRGAGPKAETRVTSAPPPSKTMEGLLEEIPLTDVLQMFSSTKKSGVLRLEWGSRTAYIYIKGGPITYAAYQDIYDMPARKVLFRLLGLNEGKFTMMQYSNPPDFSEVITESTEFLLMEGLRRIDEQRSIENQLGLPGSNLQINFPLQKPLRDLTPEQLDIFQMLYNSMPYEMLLDISPCGDLETIKIVKDLMDGKYIKLV